VTDSEQKWKKIGDGLSDEKGVIPLDFQENMEQFSAVFWSPKFNKMGVGQHGLLILLLQPCL